MTLLSLAGIPATSVRLVTPWNGAWFAEVELDLASDTAPLPSGRAVLTIGDELLTGAIDPRATSRLGAKASVRVVAGGGAWDAPVAALHFHNDAGVTLAAVAQATAAEVGEVVGDAPKSMLGVDYVRSAGPASRILHADPWYVDDAGVTRIAARAEYAAPKDLEILGWDPASATAELAPDVIARPGWILTDARFGAQTIRDVEQVWSASGTRATAFCAASTRSRLAGTLAHAVRELAGIAHLKAYRYRVVLMAGERVALQAVEPAAGMPDAIPLSMVFGLPGATAMLTPGQEVLVEFVAGDPAKPYVRAFVDGTPLQLGLDATAILDLAESTKIACNVAPAAATVNIGAAGITRLGPGAQPIALAPGVLAVVGALGSFAELMGPIIGASTAKKDDVTAAKLAAESLGEVCKGAPAAISATKVLGG